MQHSPAGAPPPVLTVAIRHLDALLRLDPRNAAQSDSDSDYMRLCGLQADLAAWFASVHQQIIRRERPPARRNNSLGRPVALTVEEAASELGAHVETVRRWIREGRVKAIMPGGYKMGYRIPPAEIDRLLSTYLDVNGLSSPLRREPSRDDHT